MALVSTYLHTILKLSLWLAAFIVVFVPLERFCAVHPHKTLRNGLAVDLTYYFLNSLIPAMILSPLGALLVWCVHQVIPVWIGAGLPLLIKVPLAFIAGELGYYWGHRMSHQIPFLWRFHAIHHSAEEMDFLINTRAHPLDMVFGRFCAMIPLVVFGLAGPTKQMGGTVTALIVLVIGTSWGFFIHSNIRCNLGPLEWLITSPRFHHWHHTKYGAIDHNYSSTLPWLDRLFGTHNLPREWPDSYGIDDTMPPTLLGQLQYPMMGETRGEESGAQPQAEPMRYID